MENNQVQKTEATGIKGISQFLNSESIKTKFTEILGNKGVGFISSLLSVISQNQNLANANQNSIYTAALMAASLDLPINPNLGFAYIVPYNAKQPNGEYKQMAQFQLGYRGFKQLAQRSGQFLRISDTDVREGELISHDRMSGEIIFKWEQDTSVRLTKKVIGYLSYFKLLNGFESTFFMTTQEIDAHAKRYSQTYKKYNSGLWKDDFENMAKKTVTKLNLSKNAPLSIEMQKAIISDQSVIKNDNFSQSDTVDVETEYVDNQEVITTEITQAQVFSIEDYLDKFPDCKEKQYLKIKADYKNYTTYQEGVTANNYLSGLK